MMAAKEGAGRGGGDKRGCFAWGWGRGGVNPRRAEATCGRRRQNPTGCRVTLRMGERVVITKMKQGV
jgi:hypothetical protein